MSSLLSSSSWSLNGLLLLFRKFDLWSRADRPSSALFLSFWLPEALPSALCRTLDPLNGEMPALLYLM